MDPIDLVDYSDHSVKISSKTLDRSQKPQRRQLWKVLFAHWLDLCLVAQAALLSNYMMTEGTLAYFPSPLAAKAVTSGLNWKLGLFTTMLIGYYFACFFLNHGQSLGMMVMKKRVHMRAMDTKRAFQWAKVSALISMTGGLVALVLDVHKMFVQHDHLYHELVSEKDALSMDLLAHIETRAHDEVHSEFRKAA
jgi:hypothetical protein